RGAPPHPRRQRRHRDLGRRGLAEEEEMFMTTPLTGAPASVPGTDKSAPAAVSGGVSPPRPTLLSRDIAMLGPRQREELARIYDARARFLERFADCIRKGEPRDLRNQEQLDDALLLDWKRK